MKRGYRAIAPASSSLSGPNSTGKDDEKSEPSSAKKKRSNVLVACNNCRAKKSACDGERPACTRCEALGRVCEYVTTNKEETVGMALKHQLDEVTASLKQHADVIERLRSAPQSEADAILLRLRSTSDVSTVLSAIRTSVSPKRLSEHRTARAVLPTTDTEIEFELVVHHKIAYRALIPIDVFSLDLNNLTGLGSGSLSPRESVAASILEEDTTSGTTEGGVIDPRLLITETSSPLRGAPAKRGSAASGPPQLSHFWDTRLQGLDLRFWTTIPVSSDFAARAISHYLETDHRHNGWFDADLFLNDLIGRRLEHCSVFLVSSLFSLACTCYTGYDKRAASFSLAFFREAEQLWKVERSSDAVTTLAAINILAMAAAYIGKDNVSRDLVVDARIMAERMELFGALHPASKITTFSNWSEAKLRATAHVAWGTYCWLTFHTTFYRGAPIPSPPALPIPGDGKNDGSSKFENQTYHQAGYIGHTFASICKFWVIIQEVLAFYISAGEGQIPIHERVPLAFAESRYQKLLALADTLEESMTLGEHSQSHVLVFQTLYHIGVLDIFRPFIKENYESRLMSFASPDSSPDAVFNASLKQLKRIILEYRIRFRGRQYSAWLNPAVQHVCNVVIRETKDLTWRFYFSLCTGYWKESVVSFPVMTAIGKANLSLALSIGCVTSDEAQTTLHEIEFRARHHEKAGVAASSIADFERAVFADDEIRIDELGQRFEMLTWFDDEA